MVQVDPRALGSLRRQWFAVAALYGVALVLGYQLLAGAAAPATSTRWLLLAALAIGVQLAILWWALPFNYSRGAVQFFPSLGLANSLTLARGGAACLLAGFLFSPAPAGALAWAPALLYGAERVVDLGDGWVARRTRRETELGSILDIEFDGLGLFIAIGVAVGFGALPVWYLLLGLTRPLFALGLGLRRRRGMPVFDLPPSDHRRVIAGLQTGFVAVALWPVWSHEASRLVGALFAVPLALSFGRDWLVVSGRVDASATAYKDMRRRAKRWIEGVLPVLLRLVAAGLAAALAVRGGLPVPWTALLLAAALLLALGVLGRLAALAVLVAAGLVATASGLTGATAALMAVCAALIHLGSGNYALWKPEERLIRIRLGD